MANRQLIRPGLDQKPGYVAKVPRQDVSPRQLNCRAREMLLNCRAREVLLRSLAQEILWTSLAQELLLGSHDRYMIVSRPVCDFGALSHSG